MIHFSSDHIIAGQIHLLKAAGNSSCSGLVLLKSSNNISITLDKGRQLCVYEILQFPLDDEEFFGGLCGGLKDLERFKLLPLLELLPDAVLLATE